MKVKALAMTIKAVSGDGVFEGYLSRFNDEDLEEDIVLPGAFTKTLAEKGPRRPLLWQHSSWDPVGVLDAKQDDQGLFITGRLNLDVQRGKEAHSLVKQGAVTGLSQGFRTVSSTQRPTPSRGRFLTELDLWEGSLATFPALPSAQILNVRSALPPWRQADVEADAKADEAQAAKEAAQETRNASLQRLAGLSRRAKA